MNKRTLLLIGLLASVPLLVLLVHLATTRPRPSGFPLSLATVQGMKDGSITYEVRQGEILVTVLDRYGDAHIHVLQHPGLSQEEALGILASKQAELGEAAGTP